MTGEAELRTDGLWIDDRTQGWRLKIGEISRELIAGAVHGFGRQDYEEFRRWELDIQQSGPILGVWWEHKF